LKSILLVDLGEKISCSVVKKILHFILIQVAEVFTTMEIKLPMQFNYISHHWALHLPLKFTDHGTFAHVNMFPEERLHQTLRTLSGKSKRNVSSTLAKNYNSFSQLHLDWSVDKKVLGITSTFNTPDLQPPTRQVIYGTGIHNRTRGDDGRVRKSKEFDLGDDLFVQLCSRLNPGDNTISRKVEKYKYVFLDQKKFCPDRYVSVHQDNSFFTSLYLDVSTQTEKYGYGRIKEIFSHTYQQVKTAYVVAEWYEEINNDVTTTFDIQPVNPVSGLRRLIPSSGWGQSLEVLTNLYPVSYMFYLAFPIPSMVARMRGTQQRKYLLTQLREVCKEKNANLVSFDQ